MRRMLLGVICGLFSAATIALAQAPASQSGAAAPEAAQEGILNPAGLTIGSGDNKVVITARRSTLADREMALSGDVVVQIGNFRVRADRAVARDGELLLEGDVRIQLAK